MIELVVALLVLGTAIIAGSQLFVAASRGYSNASRLTDATNKLASTFGTGEMGSGLPENVSVSQVVVDVRVGLPSGTISQESKLVSVDYADAYLRSQLFGLGNSFGEGN